MDGYMADMKVWFNGKKKKKKKISSKTKIKEGGGKKLFLSKVS